MKNEIVDIIESKRIYFAFLMDDIWYLRVGFLSDLFDKLNILNLSLQGALENVITISGKLKAFNEKLALWKLKIVNENYGSFPIVECNSLKSVIKEVIYETLMSLSESFKKYSPNLDVLKTEWVVNPFIQCKINHLEHGSATLRLF
jgi:hypothetical protein